MDESSWGKWAHFDTTGQAVTLFGLLDDPEFFESRIPYTVDVMLTLDLSSPVDISFEQRPDFYSDLDPAPPSDDYDTSMDGMLTFTRPAYDQQTVVSLIQPKVSVDDDDSDGFFSSLGKFIGDYTFAVLLSIILMLGAAGTIGYTVRLKVEEDALDAIVLKEYEEEL